MTPPTIAPADFIAGMAKGMAVLRVFDTKAPAPECHLGQPYKLIFGYHWLSVLMQNVVDGGYYGLQSLAQGSCYLRRTPGLERRLGEHQWKRRHFH